MGLAGHDTNPPPGVDNIRSAMHASYDPRDMGNADKQVVRKQAISKCFLTAISAVFANFRLSPGHFDQTCTN